MKAPVMGYCRGSVIMFASFQSDQEDSESGSFIGYEKSDEDIHQFSPPGRERKQKYRGVAAKAAIHLSIFCTYTLLLGLLANHWTPVATHKAYTDNTGSFYCES